MKLMTGGALVAVMAGATMFGASDVQAQARDTYSLDGRAVAIYNLAGTARIVQGSGSEVVVRVMRAGSDAAQLEIATGEIRGRETLRVIYPDDQVRYDPPGRGSFNTTIRVRADGTFSDNGRRAGSRVEVGSRGRGLEAHANLEIEVPRGVELALYLAVGEVEAEGVEGDLRIDTGAGNVTASDMSGALVVDTGSGSVNVTGMRGDYLTIDTGSGSIEVSDIEGSEVTIDTGSGRVEGERITADELNVDTGSGSIELEAITVPDVFLDTGSGSVRVEFLSDVDDLVVDTGSGSVIVALPESAGAAVEIETGSGGIGLDLPLLLKSASRDHVVGELGDGRGSIEIDSGSGSVRLVRSGGRVVR
jgi:lia operon protein LiaG